MILRLPLALVLVLNLNVCRQEMQDMPRHEPLEASEVFADGMSARTPVPGTVARDADLSEVPESIPYPVRVAYSWDKGEFTVFRLTHFHRGLAPLPSSAWTAGPAVPRRSHG